jgi:hypothetical protein
MLVTRRVRHYQLRIVESPKSILKSQPEFEVTTASKGEHDLK